METFLQLLAQDIVRKYGEKFENLTIIFPNKRAGLFLSEELSKLISRPVWMPEILTLSEYIEKHTRLKKANPLTLIIKLYKAYIQASGFTEKFEDFYFWGNMLLSDFDDVDKYLADAYNLFSNLSALKEFEYNFPYLTEEQICAIRKFWNSFNTEKYSREQLEFLKVWDKLYDTYTIFRKNLFKEKICYEGMNERYFYEHITEYKQPKHILFAGFNALNMCEKHIFAHYRDAGIARFYWDYDIYYTSDEHQEAGLYMRENLKLFPNELGQEYFNNFLHNGKQIEYISVPSSIGQAKLLPKLTEYNPENPRETAIVLCDEQMLIPVLHSIPKNVGKINVTMGYPAQKTSITSLISLLCDLKNYLKQENNSNFYYYKTVSAILTHKLIKETSSEKIEETIRHINQYNIIYVPENILDFHPLIQAIFVSDKNNLPTYLLHILNLLNIYTVSEPIEKEFLFTIYTQIQSIQNTFIQENIVPEDKLYARIIHKIISNITIPFSGEPLEGLQVMGLMETRMLDFKNIILLSANEGILPKITLPSSYIPYNLRVGFRLPTPEHQDALFAYYFYRLLQRSCNIRILYSSGHKGINSGEMSRFLFQIKYESGLTVQEHNFQNLISTSSPQKITIPFNQDIRGILENYQLSEEKAISPSALNIYMECPVRFYFKYIANIKEPEEISEDIDQRLLGNIFHECSQAIYKDFIQKNITPEIIDSLIRDEKNIEKHIKKAYLKIYDNQTSKLLDSGNNELILNAIKKYLQEMLAFDKKIAPFRILAMESRFYVPIKIETEQNTRTIYVGGFIDRVDQTNEGIRIIDYKTGSDDTNFKTISSLFDSSSSSRNKAAFQTMLYCLMFDHIHPCNLPLIPGIYNTKQLFTKNYDYHLLCNKTPITNFRQYQDEFLTELQNLLIGIFSSEKPFEQTENSQKCRNCSYATICRR